MGDPLGGARAGEEAGLWPLRVIDDTSEGADGVKLGDLDGDGHLDVVTGWEEGGTVRAYLHPGTAGGAEAVRQPWPMIEVGKAPDVEDAAWIDLDGDGDLDVVACIEGKERKVYFFYNETPPATKDADAPVGNAAARYRFRRVAVPAFRKAKVQWMFAWPLDVDGKNGMDLVVGGKNKDAAIGWLQAPPTAKAGVPAAGVPAAGDGSAWRWHPLSPATWIMSIWFEDVDGDGDQDIVYSDRRGPTRGMWWLEKPAGDPTGHWPAHRIWSDRQDIMSFTPYDLDGDGAGDYLVAMTRDRIVWLRRVARAGEGGAIPRWTPISIPLPKDAGMARAVQPGDLDGDGDPDLAVTTWNAKGLQGVLWLENDGTPLDGGWRARPISGVARGIKYDRIELLDLDGDGDLDLMTCEEHEKDGGLGVIWYENPHRQPAATTPPAKPTKSP